MKLDMSLRKPNKSHAAHGSQFAHDCFRLKLKRKMQYTLQNVLQQNRLQFPMNLKRPNKNMLNYLKDKLVTFHPPSLSRH